MTTCPADCGAESPDGLLCARCTTALERELGDVPAIVADLDVTISRQARIGSGGKGGLASERTPVHLGAIEAADVLTNTLTTWAREINPECAGVWQLLAGRGLAKTPADAAARALLACIAPIRRHPAAAELCDEVTDAIRQARRAVDRPADRVYLGICHYIEAEVECLEEVYASPGASEARCKVCGITHEVAERRAWLLGRAEDTICTVREAAQMLGEIGHIPVTEQRIRRYIERKRIPLHRIPDNRSKDITKMADALRLGDLTAVVLEDEAKRRTA